MDKQTYVYAAKLLVELEHEWHTLRELGQIKLQQREFMYRVVYYDHVSLETASLADACEEFASSTVFEREK